MNKFNALAHNIHGKSGKKNIYIYIYINIYIFFSKFIKNHSQELQGEINSIFRLLELLYNFFFGDHVNKKTNILYNQEHKYML